MSSPKNKDRAVLVCRSLLVEVVLNRNNTLALINYITRESVWRYYYYCQYTSNWTTMTEWMCPRCTPLPAHLLCYLRIRLDKLIYMLMKIRRRQNYIRAEPISTPVCAVTYLSTDVTASVLITHLHNRQRIVAAVVGVAIINIPWLEQSSR